MKKMDLKKLADSLTEEDIIRLVTELGSDEYKMTNDAIIFKTICHNIDPTNAKLKLYYYKKNKKFHCYTDCGDNFNIFELFKRRYQLLGIKYNFYNDIVLKISKGIRIDDFNNFSNGEEYSSVYEKYKQNEIKVEIPTIPKSLLNAFIFYPTTEWLSEGITKETMEQFDIRYSISGNKIIIPHYNYDGDLIGIRCRFLNDEDIENGKYMPVQIEGVTYSHPLGYNLYGLNLVKDNIKKYKMAIIVEGEKSVLLYNSYFGFSNNICVAVCGSSLHRYQVNLLLKAGAERIVIAFDKEGDSWKEKSKYYNKLNEICQRYNNICQMGFIYDTKNLLSLKDSPLDRGKDTFLELYKNTIWI